MSSNGLVLTRGFLSNTLPYRTSYATFFNSLGALYSTAPVYSTPKWYVSPTGSNSNTGLSPSQAWLTITFAAQNASVAAGDVVGVLPGTYTENVSITRGGSAAAGNTVYRSLVMGAAKIVGAALHSSTVVPAAHYITLDGFDITTFAGGDQHGVDLANSAFIGPHHQTVRNCLIHDCGGSAIAAAWGDYYMFEDNVVWNNCQLNTYQTSAINIYQAIPFDTVGGFHNVIRRNVAYNNYETNAAASYGSRTDGNGFIIDDFNHTQTSGHNDGIPYVQQTLLDSNLSYSNGGKGYHVFQSQYVTAINNVAWKNSTDLGNPSTWRSEINNHNGNNNTYINNIAICDSSINANNDCFGDKYGGGTSSNVVYEHNSTLDVNAPTANSFSQSGSGATIRNMVYHTDVWFEALQALTT
jgi:hypothetical protein